MKSNKRYEGLKHLRCCTQKCKQLSKQIQLPFSSLVAFNKRMHPPWNVTQLTLGFNLSTESLLPHTWVFLITSQLLRVNNTCKGATYIVQYRTLLV